VTQAQQILAGLAAAAALVQGIDNVVRALSPPQVDGPSCAATIEALSVSLSMCARCD
jgi:hypothetical protein